MIQDYSENHYMGFKNDGRGKNLKCAICGKSFKGFFYETPICATCECNGQAVDWHRVNKI